MHAIYYQSATVHDTQMAWIFDDETWDNVH